MNMEINLRAALFALFLLGAASAYAAPFAYITSEDDGTVSVIDTATNTVTTTIPVGRFPLGVAVNAAGTRAYVGNYEDQSISVIDTSTNTVVDTVSVSPNDVQGIAVSADGTRVYAVGGETGMVSVIDTATDTVIATIAVGRAPRSVAVNPAGTRVYVGNSTDNDHGGFTVIDATNNTVITAIAVAAEPWGIVVDHTGTRVFVSHRARNSATGDVVSVVDAQTNTVIATPVVPGSSDGLAMNHAGTRIYVTNTNFDSSVSVLDAHCAEVIANIPLPLVQGESRFLYGISVAPDDSHVYVVTDQQNYAFNSVAVIDANTNTVVDDIAVGSRPWSLGVFISPGVVATPPPPAPIRVTGIEITQGIQDLANHVSLVPGKRTFARVYVKSDAADIPNVTATLSGLGSYTDGGGHVVQIPLGPIVPSNAGGPRISVKADPKRNIVDDSFVFEIPWEWMGVQNLRLGASLSEPAAPPPPSGACMSDLEQGPGLEFDLPTHIKVAFVRMGYDFPGANTERASSAEQRQTESWMRRVYPLSDLNPTPDFEVFDALLGSWVERTAEGCLIAFTGGRPQPLRALLHDGPPGRAVRKHDLLWISGWPSDRRHRCRLWPDPAAFHRREPGALFHARRLLHEQHWCGTGQRRRLCLARDRPFSGPHASGPGRAGVRALGERSGLPVFLLVYRAAVVRSGNGHGRIRRRRREHLETNARTPGQQQFRHHGILPTDHVDQRLHVPLAASVPGDAESGRHHRRLSGVRGGYGRRETA